MSSWNSRRSVVYSLNGISASSQPLASQIGIDILKKGGNAVDAAVAMAAALNVTEPTSTGIGGDAFLLFYDAKKKEVFGLNGSGCSPATLTPQLLKEKGGLKGNGEMSEFSAHAVTVPGAAALWVDAVQTYGSRKLSLSSILLPAIELAEQGFPVSSITSYQWSKSLPLLLNALSPSQVSSFLLDGEAPKEGEVIKNPKLAQTFRELGEKGKEGFYQGRIAQAIVNAVQSRGGVLSLSDLSSHSSLSVTPISISYKGIRVFEIPPNSQGITPLLALNLLKGFDLSNLKHNSAEYLHLLIEALRLAFADAKWYVSDPSNPIPLDQLLSDQYASSRRSLISPHSTIASPSRGIPFASSDTVYFTVVDGEGNAASFINSNYMGFGTGIEPEGCGFTLQNRGANFTLEEGHPNCLAPSKRPYHTIIPAMALNESDGSLFASFGVMGGFMQPQGHVQVLLNMLEFGMNPQIALDAPRFCIEPSRILIEDGIPSDVIDKLKQLGHVEIEENQITGYQRIVFGKGQIIQQLPNSVFAAGSDPRGDGVAVGF